MDAIENASRKRKKKMWCNICHKFNHNTRDCFKNPSNLPTDNDSTIAEEFDFGVNNDNVSLGNGAIGEV